MVAVLAVGCGTSNPQNTTQATGPADTPGVSAPAEIQSPTSVSGPTGSMATPPSQVGSHPRRRPPQLGTWPHTPARAKLGDRGEHVRAWQQILIQAGAISDIPENHDGYYGPGMYQVVLRMQQSWGWSDADGIAGPKTCQMIASGAPVPPPQPLHPAPTPVGDRDCADFISQAEAQAYFEAQGGSPSNNVDRLDRDGDGIACEEQ
jgi:peptidoglycan hydrolase-like protein with peptidoglycan-binding domain